MTIDEALKIIEDRLMLIDMSDRAEEALDIAVNCMEMMKDIEADIKKNKTCVLVDVEWFNKKYKEVEE